MEETQTPAPSTDAQAAPPPQTTPPASADTNAATADNTAPSAKEVAREAFARLERGEAPDAVNRELYQKAKPGTAAPSGTSATPAAKEGTPAGGSGQQGESKTPPADNASPTGEQTAPENVTPEDLQVLRRAKFDLSAWKHIPPSNRRAIINNFKASQAEADRQFQQGRAGSGQPAPASTPSQTQTGRQDEATPAEGQQREAAGGQPPAASPPPAAQQPPAAGPDIAKLIDPKDLETLRNLGGDELADTFTRGIQNAVQATLQQVAPQQEMVNWLINQVEEREFGDAISNLKSQPGFENLTPEQVQAIRAKSDLLIRAAGDLKSYRHEQGVSDAAASLFRSNVQQTAQANLLRGRQASLQQGAERGTGRIPAPRTLTPQQRHHAIFEKLQEGMTPDEARRAVDGR